MSYFFVVKCFLYLDYIIVWLVVLHLDCLTTEFCKGTSYSNFYTQMQFNMLYTNTKKEILKNIYGNGLCIKNSTKAKLAVQI